VSEALVLAALVAYTVALVVTNAAERVSRRRGLLDVPNSRSSHVTPTPRIGGIGIVAGVAAASLLVGGWEGPGGLALLASSAVLGGVGLADDLGRTSLIGKYLAQLVSSAVVTVAMQPTLAIEVQTASLTIEGIAAVVISTLWLTAVINAFNFIDGIDGMLASLVVVIGIVGASMASPGAGEPLVAVAAACLGFLVWNHAPATIFMGDVGSQFLGLWVGTSLLGAAGGTAHVIPIVILFGIVLFDTGLTLVRRSREGRNLFAAHREHLYQRLVTSGVSHRTVTAAYAGATAALGALALTWSAQPLPMQLGVVVLLAVAGWLLVAWVRRAEAAAPGR
jgi:UDP-N-acetylmuramyl pentapeptide phosphotransferase/UDP-N-acetylglucosamine-1-phosphate transferase